MQRIMIISDTHRRHGNFSQALYNEGNIDMLRLWCKLFDSSNHMIKDMVAVNDDPKLNRTKKIFDGIKEACYEFDLSEPMWMSLIHI